MVLGDLNFVFIIFFIMFTSIALNVNTALHLLLTAELLWITLYILCLFTTTKMCHIRKTIMIQIFPIIIMLHKWCYVYTCLVRTILKLYYHILLSASHLHQTKKAARQQQEGSLKLAFKSQTAISDCRLAALWVLLLLFRCSSAAVL